MKKTISLILSLLLVFTLLAGCAPIDDTRLNIGYMTGPTGIGMAKLIDDNGGLEGNDKYSFTSFDNTNLAMTKLINGEVDVICYPTNDAANFINKNDADISVLAINTLGTLFLITDENNSISSFDELNGKTIYTCKNGTPRVILENLIKAYDIDATVSYTIGDTEIATPKDLAAQVIAGKIDIAVAPEPIVSNILTKKANFSLDLDLATVWENKYNSKLAMGCIIARNDFINEHKTVIDRFLNEYDASISFIASKDNRDTSAELVASTGIQAPAANAKVALGNLENSIKYIDGTEMKQILVEFYKALGITLPKDEFYYAG